MKEEMNALERNSTWEIIDKPRDKKNGPIERYKARLVAKGYTQTYGIDYEETFAPVAKMNTVRVVLTLAAHFGWDLHRLDVKNVFLHGNLEEEVYMETPPGFEVQNERNKVCLLKKALYGLKQSPRAWFGRFTKAMVSLGYRQSQGDHTLFIKHSSTGKLTLLLVYVDDMIIAGDDETEKLALKEKLAAQFEMKDLGKLQTSTVPIEQNHRIGSEESVPVEKAQYQRLVGKLIYLSYTRPDIAYAVSVMSQFMHDPRERHMQAVDKILQYLKSNLGKGLLFKREDTLVTWRSKMQDRVSRSSAETKFQALAQGMCEGLGMKIILDDLKVKVDNPVQLYCDNKSAIRIAHNPVQHDRTKHI
uniref:Retrovirus-related Pol polyprotein from transposon TNT 1-94 n=1 Tax=Cajanus cajan TaxID=3821 RepID=A0A151R3J2_CAJCA|nr:Retrovirus-related Pol polyprotein from transposon TNT 1-94 [Cajanus cajan]